MIPERYILIRNAHQYNLKGIDLAIPLGAITVITGPSGSGKSTLVFDCLFAEGQQRYLDSMEMNPRRFVNLLDRPAVDGIDSLPPPIALKQKRPLQISRSTLASRSDVLLLLRMLFATYGTAYCPVCQTPIRVHTVDEIADEVLSLEPKTRITLLAPIAEKTGNMALEDLIGELRQQGFLRLRIDGRMILLDQVDNLDEPPSSLELVIDRIVLKPGTMVRLVDSLNLALKAGNGTVIINVEDQETKSPHDLKFSEKMACPDCGRDFPELAPELFSYLEPCIASVRHGPDMGTSGKCLNNVDDFASNVRIHGTSLPELMDFTVSRSINWLIALKNALTEDTTNAQATRIGTIRIIESILDKLTPLAEMGLGYLELGRPLSAMSGGEIQRLRLGSLIGKGMTGCLYILDEPTQDLHPEERRALNRCIQNLKKQGNTIILVEHDLEIISKADHVIELGPGAGEAGGRVIFEGSPADLAKSGQALTGPFLKGTKVLRRHNMASTGTHPKGWLQLKGSSTSTNPKGIAVEIPLNRLVCITGVSGSGKTSLIFKELLPELEKALKASRDKGTPLQTKRIRIKGRTRPHRIISIDQGPLARSRRSMPATFMGIFSYIREIFSRTPEARARGLDPSYFSVNLKGGRCERCKGLGTIMLDLRYLPPVMCRCDICQGMRYNRDALSITFKGLNMAEVLNLSVRQAADFFSRIPRIRGPLEILERVGLGYLKLGQPSISLSGGEAQRLKMARELIGGNGEERHSIYLMDTPTRGMHLADIQKFIIILDELLEQGHSLIIIENQPQFVSVADWIIELGPKGGPEGGCVIAQGPRTSLSIKNNNGYSGRLSIQRCNAKKDTG